MGESERYMENRGRGRYAPGLHFNINSPLVLLICINITAYLLITLLNFGNTIGDTALAPFFYGKMHSFLVPANPATTLSQPWSIITYSFFHFRFLTLLSNMIWLFGLGSILQSIAGNKMTVPIYLYGAVAGAFVFILSNAFLKGNISVIPLQGSNTALLAIAIAVTTLEPRYRSCCLQIAISSFNGSIAPVFTVPALPTMQNGLSPRALSSLIALTRSSIFIW